MFYIRNGKDRDMKEKGMLTAFLQCTLEERRPVGTIFACLI